MPIECPLFGHSEVTPNLLRNVASGRKIFHKNHWVRKSPAEAGPFFTRSSSGRTVRGTRALRLRPPTVRRKCRRPAFRSPRASSHAQTRESRHTWLLQSVHGVENRNSGGRIRDGHLAVHVGSHLAAEGVADLRVAEHVAICRAPPYSRPA